jgi:hypothetical protein
MAIGRTDERHNPFIPVATQGRAVVWMSFADPIWASGQRSRVKGRTHDRIRTKASISQSYLNPTGRPHMIYNSLNRRFTVPYIATAIEYRSLALITKGSTVNIFLTPRLFATALLGAALLAGSPALATELREGQSDVTQLSADASAVTSFVDRPDGFHILVTVRTRHDATADTLHQPPAVRFSSRILPGQTIDLSMQEPAGPADTVLEITRRADRVAVETKHSVALVN